MVWSAGNKAMICANNVLPVFITKALLAPSPGEQRAIQIRPSNELSETLMYQSLPGEFGSANRTAVISSRYRSLHMSHVPVFARALLVQEFLNLGSSVGRLAKTAVRNARQEHFDFLGYSFGPHYYRKDGHLWLYRDLLFNARSDSGSRYFKKSFETATGARRGRG